MVTCSSRQTRQKSIKPSSGIPPRPAPRHHRRRRHFGFEFADLAVDIDRHQVLVKGSPVSLTPHEFSLLAYMIQNPQRVLTPREFVKILQHYDAQDEVEAREIIKWYVHRLRQKIEADPNHLATC